MADRQFSEKLARRDLKKLRTKGPNPTTRHLIDALKARSIQDSELVDVGSGIGALTQELLAAGVARATLVDESTAYQKAALELATERGTDERCEFVHADFTEARADLGPVDIVTLDRVVCCYPDVRTLLEAVSATDARLCGMSYPHDRWYVRVLVGLGNLGLRLRRSDFRIFVHPEREMLGRLSAAGFEESSRSGTFVWSIVLLERREASAA